MKENQQLKQIKGIGPKKIQLLKKLSIGSIEELLQHYPRRYENSIRGTITKIEIIRPKNGLTVFKAYLEDKERNIITAVWFNRPFLKKSLQVGQEIDIIGKTKEQWGNKEIYVEDYEVSTNNKNILPGRLVPVYPSIEGLNQKFWRFVMWQALSIMKGRITEVFAAQIKNEYELMSREEALFNIHFPVDLKKQKEARYRLAFEELFLWQVSINKFRQEKALKQGIKHNKDVILCNDFVHNLSFALTSAQERVIKEINDDMENNSSMQRLLQGDVGSGKTVVAGWAMLKAVGSGYQAVLMAPTEILAKQHYDTLSKWCEPLGVKVSFLTGNMTKTEREETENKIQQGIYKIVIGTHVLLQKSVVFKNAGLIVIDEQHRFGVKQREILEEKTNNPDVLIMSATPIPRTLAMTLYGDLDISVLDELPPGRKIIHTICIKAAAKTKLYRFLHDKLIKGAQIYVVCPTIEESDKLSIQNATSLAEEMRTELAPINVGLLHGKMNSVEKDKVMSGFIKGSIQILVSTTVIEVGINVPQATVMVIEDAERFGLSQLHQLRGRVGRGEDQSYCILVTTSKNNEALQRLKLMTEISDGFQLAEEDMKIRGPGELLGMKQHGMLNFRIADLLIDKDILFRARNLAMKNITKTI